MKGRRAAASAAVLLLSPLIVASDENSAEDWGWDRFHGVDLDLDADGSADKINNSEGSRLAALDEYFARSREEWNVPGMAIAIVKDNSVVFSKGYGVRDSQNSLPVTNQTRFAIASNTKAFTATALAILVDEGKISWDDKVQTYLPYFELYDPWVSQQMQIRDLLSHRSGLGTYSGDLLWFGTSSTYSREDVVKRTRYLTAEGSFRADYGYSNLMFIAAGEVVQAVTGQSWDEFVQARIFVPLEMKSTVTSIKDIDLKNLRNIDVATPHKVKLQPNTNKLEHIPIDWSNWDNIAAAGGIISSISDMAQWLRLHLSRGIWGGEDGDIIFGEGVQRTMWTAHITTSTVTKGNEKTYPSTHFKSYGLGFDLMDYKQRKVIGHGGTFEGMKSRVTLVPEENLGFVILTNGQAHIDRGISYRILDAFLGSTSDGEEQQDWSAKYYKREKKRLKKRLDAFAELHASRVEGTQMSHSFEKYTGSYEDQMYGDASITVEEEDQLVIRFGPNPDLVGYLSHFHYDTFEISWQREFAWFDEGMVEFLVDQMTNQITGIKMDVPNEDLWFHELNFSKNKGGR